MHPLTPCWHMRTLLVAKADGHLRGWRRAFAELHLKGCPQCRAALEALRGLGARLRRLQDAPALSLAPEREAAIARAWEDRRRDRAPRKE